MQFEVTCQLDDVLMLTKILKRINCSTYGVGITEIYYDFDHFIISEKDGVILHMLVIRQNSPSNVFWSNSKSDTTRWYRHL